MNWKSLKIGDKIRFFKIPNQILNNPNVSSDTLKVYAAIIANNKYLEVQFIDEKGVPWVKFREVRRGITYHHELAINYSDGFILKNNVNSNDRKSKE